MTVFIIRYLFSDSYYKVPCQLSFGVYHVRSSVCYFECK